jgi:hypothetical protein
MDYCYLGAQAVHEEALAVEIVERVIVEEYVAPAIVHGVDPIARAGLAHYASLSYPGNAEVANLRTEILGIAQPIAESLADLFREVQHRLTNQFQFTESPTAFEPLGRPNDIPPVRLNVDVIIVR